VPNLENLNVVVVFPDLMGRTKFREVLRSILYKSEISHEKDLRTIAKKISEGLISKVDFIFISSKLPHSEIGAFLSGIAAAANPNPPSVVICLPGLSFNSSGLVAGWYLEGAAGFVSEPFATADISELLETIIEDKKKSAKSSSESKSRKAAKFLLADAVFLVDELAKLRSQGKEGGYTIKSLRSLSTAFANFYEQDKLGFETAIIDVFEKAKAPVINPQLAQKKTVMKQVKHPGTIIWDMMKQRNLEEDRMAALLKMELKDLNDLLWGKSDVTEPIAQNLSRALGMSPREWMKMQTDFKLYQEKTGAIGTKND
jgi:addiction module HigA family antidote